MTILVYLLTGLLKSITEFILRIAMWFVLKETFIEILYNIVTDCLSKWQLMPYALKI